MEAGLRFGVRAVSMRVRGNGFRYQGKEIMPHKFRIKPERDWSQRSPLTGSVSALPSLEYYDRRSA